MPSSAKAKIKIVAIEGSVRPENYTGKVLALAVEELKQLKDVSCEVIDLRTLSLPLPGMKSAASTDAFREKVNQATGVILSTPEYHGSYSSVIKLAIENLGYPSVLAGKPVVLIGVASGQIGAIKALEHLRSVCSHIGAIVLPSTVSVANVNKVMDQNGKCSDQRVERRIRSAARHLMDYINNHICPKEALEEYVRGRTA